MRYSTTSVILAAMVVGKALAGPTHAHFHQRAHEKKDIDYSKMDWNNMGIDYDAEIAKAKAGKTTPAPVVAATPAAPTKAAILAEKPASSSAAAPSSAKPSSSTAATSSGSNSGLFNNIKGVSNDRTSFGGRSATSGALGDFREGNVGVPYGSNIMKVASASGNTYTNTFKNTQSKSITVNVWNKKGSDGQPLSGSALAPKDTTLTFVLAPGASQTVAFDEDSQVAWAEACSGVTASGAFAQTWGEANFVKTGSGYDVSAILNPLGNNYKMKISSVEAPQCTSDSQGTNFWIAEFKPVGSSDGSCFIAQAKATLTTEMGGSM